MNEKSESDARCKCLKNNAPGKCWNLSGALSNLILSEINFIYCCEFRYRDGEQPNCDLKHLLK